MAVDEADTSRTAVRTYVPAYQRDRWDEHADELDMSRSEFVRTMVQAGRRGFDPRGDGPETTPQADSDSTADEPGPDVGATATDDGADEMEDRVLDLLSEECLGWEELVDALTADIERELGDAIESLQAENAIQHRPREGGYAIVQ